MGEYNIVHFLPENERSITKKVGEIQQRLSFDRGERVRTPKKQRAKRFFHDYEAASALALIKVK